jgi:hypothetical protein
MFLTWVPSFTLFMRRTFIVVYKPYKGRDQELLPAVMASYRDLQKGGYVTTQPPKLMKATNGSIVLIFDWKDENTKNTAQTDPVIQQHWMALSKLCEFEKPMNLTECQQPFSDFESIEID